MCVCVCAAFGKTSAGHDERTHEVTPRSGRKRPSGFLAVVEFISRRFGVNIYVTEFHLFYLHRFRIRKSTSIKRSTDEPVIAHRFHERPLRIFRHYWHLVVPVCCPFMDHTSQSPFFAFRLSHFYTSYVSRNIIFPVIRGQSDIIHWLSRLHDAVILFGVC